MRTTDWVKHVHLAHELATECVDDTSNGRSLALADEVEVEHTLHSLGLKTTVLVLARALVASDSLHRRIAMLRDLKTY